MAGNTYINVTGRVLSGESGAWCEHCALPSLSIVSVGLWFTTPGIEQTAEQRAEPQYVHFVEACDQRGCPKFSEHLVGH